jgi:hypothetical protein
MSQVASTYNKNVPAQFLIFLPLNSLTLSFPGRRLVGVLTLAIYISPNNGRIDLLLIKKNDSSCVGNPFCTLHFVSRTIIDEVTVPLSKEVVGLPFG